MTRFLAHALGEQSLSERVVYLVRAGVREVFALDVYLRAAKLRAQVFGVVQRRGPADVVGRKGLQFRLERFVALRRGILALKLLYRAHEGFGHEAAAEVAESSSLVGQSVLCSGHHKPFCIGTNRMDRIDRIFPLSPVG